MTRLLLDVTEFIGNPIFTGIQRIVREVLIHWPADHLYTLVRYDARTDALKTIHWEAARYAVDLPHKGSFDLSEALAEISFFDRAADRETVKLEPGDCLLAPELFYDHPRVAYYRRAVRAGVVVHLVVPDFLVWLRPDTFPIPSAHPLMPYLQLLLECTGRAFISQAVRRTFEERILRAGRRPEDLVLDLGADGLAIEQQHFNPLRKTLLCLGTLDGRKGQENVYEAFCSRQTGPDLKLMFIGRIPPNVSPKVRGLLTNTRHDVELITDASDATIADLFSEARASVYTSTAEGYGLPPMESLYAGVPVVVHTGLPAIEGKPDHGQLRVADDDPVTIRRALDILADDEAIKRLWAAAAKFPSVTWSESVASLSAWVSRYRQEVPSEATACLSAEPETAV